MSVKAEKKDIFICQDCGHCHFILIDGKNYIIKCGLCNLYYNLCYLKEQVSITVVDPEPSIFPYTIPRRFVTRYTTTTVKKWVPYII